MRILFVAIALLAAASCSRITQFELYGNAPEGVSVLLSSGEIRIGYGAVRRFTPPSVRDGSSGVSIIGGELRMRTQSCDLIFSVDGIRRRIQTEHVIPMQLERDFSIYILPPHTHLPASTAELEAAQRQGMLLQPRVSNCSESQR